MLGADIRTHEVRLALELADDLPRVAVDTILIQQCVVNLVRNALIAMDEEPADLRELTITTGVSHTGEIEVAVSDTGRGFAEGTADKVFEPYFTTRDDGHGMGLAISRSIIEAHGGRIWATSNPGRGITFHFALSPSPKRAEE
jgi:signal transduction histidine kinase